MRFRRLALVLISVGLFFAVVVSARQVMSATPPPQTSVVGGEPVAPGDYPWLVALLIAEVTEEAAAFCGGALIDDGNDFTTTQWVLTAAHCLVFDGEVVDPSAIEVLVGQQALSQTTPEQRRAVAEIITHPFYLPGQVLANDVALLYLAEPVVDITPIRIATPDDAARFAPDVTAQIAGWGNRLPQTGVDDPDVAHKAQLPIVNLATCNERYDGALSDMHLCAGIYPTGGVDTCQGDSGGPLMVPDGSGGLLHAGIVSFGVGCAWPHFPGVYARTAFFADWITAQINGDPHVDIWQLQLPENLAETPWYISTAAPNTPYTYTVFVANSGATPLTDLEVVVEVPDGVTLAPDSISNDGVFNGSTDEIIWNVGNLLPGELIELTYQAQADASVVAGNYRALANEATASRRREVARTLIDEPRLYVAAFAPSEVETGSIYPIEFVVINFGQGENAGLDSFELVVSLPPGIEVVDSGGGVISGSTARWSIPELPASEAVVRTLLMQAGEVGEVARITDYGLYDGETLLRYGARGAQAVVGPAIRYLPIISR
ncbi:trypsin-like serine protease [Chloroflexus sp.]|uniref:trypsin-like serine protease n=1 Tax=Chloroflexus sp. TaxID=1904827 RepID=UPI002621A4AF|nr:trypsin-like serine protease [uncultured Chloroflexus sp.]